MGADTYELSKNSEVVIEFEMEKILKIERFLLEKGVSESIVGQYTLAIYNRRGGDIDIIDNDVDRRVIEKMMRGGSVDKHVEEVSRKNETVEE